MRKIAIVGAGQLGLQLAIGLRKAGYEVIVLSAQTAEQIRAGRVTSSQCMFHSALEHERDLGINLWDEPARRSRASSSRSRRRRRSRSRSFVGPHVWIARPCPSTSASRCRRCWPNSQASAGRCAFMKAGSRTSNPSRGSRAGNRGGRQRPDRQHLRARCRQIRVRQADAGARAHVRERVAAARWLLGRLLQRGARRRRILRLSRSNAFRALRDHGLRGRAERPDGLLEAVRSPVQHLEVSLRILEEFLPWERERAAAVTLTDPNGILSGRFAPTVRHPIARLPSGSIVLGMADVVCLNDPITGQGSNNASKCAAVYLRRIPIGDAMRSTRSGCRRRSTSTGTTRVSSPIGRTRCCFHRRRTRAEASDGGRGQEGDRAMVRQRFRRPEALLPALRGPGGGRAIRDHGCLKHARRRELRPVTPAGLAQPRCA